MEKKGLGKIEKISVVDQVADALKDKIISGEWKPGDRLPAEAEIAQTYGVNRLSVRMALQRLITLGVVETRVGEGSFVRELSFYPVLSEMADFLASGERMGDIQEMRYLIERASALKAAENQDGEAAGALNSALETYCGCFDQFEAERTNAALEAYLSADLALHMQIVRMSGNRLYLEIYQMIQKLIRLHISSLVSERMQNQKNNPADYKELHIQLCRAILGHDRAATKRLLTVLLTAEPKQEYGI